MKPTLTPTQLAVMRAIDAGERVEEAPKQTLLGLWRRGIIEDVFDFVKGEPGGWQLTGPGRLALRSGRMMISGRTE